MRSAPGIGRRGGLGLPTGPWAGPPVLAPRHVAPLLAARSRVGGVETSLDLGLTRSTVALSAEGATLPAGPTVSWDDLAAVGAATTGGGNGRCFTVLPAARGAVGRAAVEEVQVYSPETSRRYSLLDTAGAPTMLISGVQMHRTSGQDPWGDTASKVATLRPLVGRVLDTCTGLGYTAVAAAQSAALGVLTIELDPVALQVARLNPWSRDLFAHPRIEQRVGDSADVVAGLPDGAFARVVHDPPAFGLAGDLYSGAFYRQLHRVLGRGGRLFHYVGNAASGSGQRVTRGVLQRLREAGFSRVLPCPEAFGVLAFK